MPSNFQCVAQPNQVHSRLRMLLHQNVDRVANEIERLNYLLHIISPNFLVITEHGEPTEEILNTQHIGYTLISSFGREHNLKGVKLFTKMITSKFKSWIQKQIQYSYNLKSVCHICKTQLKKYIHFIVYIDLQIKTKNQ